MKKILALALVLCTVALCFVACGPKDGETSALAVDKYVNQAAIDLAAKEGILTASKKLDVFDGYLPEREGDFVLLYKLDAGTGFATYAVYSILDDKIVYTETETADYSIDVYVESDVSMFVVEKSYAEYDTFAFYAKDGTKLLETPNDYEYFGYDYELDLYRIGDTGYRLNGDGTASAVLNYAACRLGSCYDVYRIGNYYVGYAGEYIYVTDQDFKYVGELIVSFDRVLDTAVIDGKFVMQYGSLLSEDAEDYTCFYYDAGDYYKVKVTTLVLDPTTMEVTYVETPDFVLWDVMSPEEGAGKWVDTLTGEGVVFADIIEIRDGILNTSDLSARKMVVLDADLSVKEDITLVTGAGINDIWFTEKLALVRDDDDALYVFDRKNGECICVHDDYTDLIGDNYYVAWEDGIYAFVGTDAEGKEAYNVKVVDFAGDQWLDETYSWNGNAFFYTLCSVKDGAVTEKTYIFCNGVAREIELSAESFATISYVNPDLGLYEIQSFDGLQNVCELFLADGTSVAKRPLISFAGSISHVWDYSNADYRHAAYVTLGDGTVYLLS